MAASHYSPYTYFSIGSRVLSTESTRNQPFIFSRGQHRLSGLRDRMKLAVMPSWPGLSQECTRLGDYFRMTSGFSSNVCGSGNKHRTKGTCIKLELTDAQSRWRWELQASVFAFFTSFSFLFLLHLFSLGYRIFNRRVADS